MNRAQSPKKNLTHSLAFSQVDWLIDVASGMNDVYSYFNQPLFRARSKLSNRKLMNTIASKYFSPLAGWSGLGMKKRMRPFDK